MAGAPDELVESHTTTRAADGSWSTPANPSLPEGDYIVRAEQADDASNVGTSAAHSFRVDTTAPDTLFTQTPPADHRNHLGGLPLRLHRDRCELRVPAGRRCLGGLLIARTPSPG